MSIPVQPGNTLPLFVLYIEPRNDLVVRATGYAREPYSLLFSDLVLPYVAGSASTYLNYTEDMPNTDFVDVRYDVFDNDGTTLLATDSEVFVKPTAGGGGGSTVYIGGPVAGVVRSESVVVGTIVAC